MAEREDQLKRFLIKMKEESEKISLKLNIQKKRKENHGIWSHHFKANRWRNNGNSEILYFPGFQNHCGHEIKRCLLLGRKSMTNLYSIFKSRDITLLTKVHIVKAIFFPVFMYGCESWTIK